MPCQWGRLEIVGEPHGGWQSEEREHLLGSVKLLLGGKRGANATRDAKQF